MIKTFCGPIVVLLLSIPTIFAQDIAIAYREGSHWGYADTLGNIIIKPVYDEVVKGWAPMTALRVAKSDKWGVVSNKGKVIVPLKHHYVSEIKTGFLLTGTKTEGDEYLHGLYNSKGKLLLKPERQDMSFFNDQILIVRSPSELKRSGVALLHSKGDKITWLMPRNYSGVFTTLYDSMIYVETDTKTIGYKVTSTNELTKISESEREITGEVMFEEVVGNEDGYPGPIKEVSVTLAINDTVTATGSRSFDLLKKTQLNRKWQEVAILEGCDQINIKQYPNGYRETFLSEKKERFVTDRWAIVRKDGKYGAFFAVPKDTFIPFVYDSIGEELLPYRCETILMKASLNGKWGLIDLNNNVIRDFVFDDIILTNNFYGSNFKTCFEFTQGLIVKKGVRFHLLTESKTDIYPKGFERALNPERPGRGLRLFEGTKRGLYYSGHLFIPSYEGDGTFADVSTGRYTLAKIVDKNNKLLGYVDKKGIVYFRD